MENKQKKIAVVNDLSGCGRCSLTVALPIISAIGLQCCPVPTAILSNHTGYPSYFMDDYTKRMPQYISEWKKLGFQFDGILTGFLGSEDQIDIVEQFIIDFKQENTTVIIDPVMGDHGKAYATYTPALCSRMKQLAARADVLTPNLTEACILTDTPYQPQFSRRDLEKILAKLSALCHGCIVITGIHEGTFLSNAVYDPLSKSTVYIRKKRVAAERSGTGDVFSSIVAADVVQGVCLADAVRKAASFVRLCLSESIQYNVPKTEGVMFEPLLKKLSGNKLAKKSLK